MIRSFPQASLPAKERSVFMLTIRKEQMDAFSHAALRIFECRMVAHLNRHFPKRCAKLGEDGVREWIRYGIERARTYGIVSERDVCKYIDVMFVYGRDFDTDRRRPWAGQILNDPVIMPPAVRTNRLFRAARGSPPPS